MTQIDVTVEAEASPEAVEAIRQRFASLERFAGKPLAGARLTLRPGKAHAKRPWTADASVLYGARRRVLAAHAAGHDAMEATAGAIRQARTKEDVVVYRRDDNRIGLDYGLVEPE